MSMRILGLALVAAALPGQDAEFFETRVRPVLAKNCYACHGADKQFSGLRVDSRDLLLRGGKRGPALTPGKPEDSLLVKAIRHEGLQMPMGSKLKDGEIAAIEEWVGKGAPWPADAAAKQASRDPAFYAKLAKEHWAFQPVKKPEAPGGMDGFIREALAKRGLEPARPASKQVLLRRLSLVLTGLPPAIEDVEAFLADTSPGAYEKAVDRLLASPRFGENWARHWLDLTRFGETHGYEWNYEIIGAWRYRDYLIRAFNNDVPYDQLVREQIAGDLLERPRINAKEQLNESLIGPAFFRLGEVGHDDCTKFREISTDVVDNQIDTLTKTFQGLTVSCARCHNHKLDPIPTEDYYGLYGILTSGRQVSRTLDVPESNAALKTRLAGLKREVRGELAGLWRKDAEGVGAKLLADRDAQKRRPEPKQMDDPFYAWGSLACETGYREGRLAAAWKELAGLYRQETEDRAAFNRKHFEPFADFRGGVPSGWHPDGLGLQDGASAPGEFAVALQGDTAVTGIFPAGMYTHALSDKLNGALRSPYLPKGKKYLSLRVMGGEYAAWRVIIDNCAIGENYKVLENAAPGWIRLETYSKEKFPIYAELVTKPGNPRIPDRPGMLKDATEEKLASPRSYFGVVSAVLHEDGATPREDLGHMSRLFEGRSEVRTWDQLAERYTRAARRAVEAWASGKATDDDVRWLDWMARGGLLTNSADATAQLKSLITEYRDTEARIAAPRVVDAMTDIGSGWDVPVLIAGDPKSPGEITQRHFLKVLTGGRAISASGSGRRELAELIASPSNPLTARVMVNRLWHHVFGRGIVASVDNFGAIGERPSHPELLDYLAGQFVEDGWSVKKMLRRMVLSETFRESGEASARSREADPQNALLQHYPLRRLPAEAIRDSILSAAGSLSDKMYGPGVQPYREEPQDYRRLFSGPLDGYGRRSIYTKITRMEGPKFLEVFDYPSTMTTRGSRDVTNVPAQALALLNDPFVVAEADAWAGRLIATPASSVDARVELMFRRALGRPPDEAERERFRGLAAELASLHQVGRDQALESRQVWKDMAHAVFNLKELIYIQ